jgi:pimeloyl-ACP methyl ester carboxylesterase
MVGASLGASIAARFAIAHPDRLSRLVLVDAGSLARFRPAPGVLLALVRFLARPSERTQRGFLRQVVVDPARAAAVLGADSQAYGLELARTPSVRAANRRLLRELGTRAIPTEQLAGIAVPTTLIWGRQDRVMRLRIAEKASARYGWPLEVIEDAGHLSLEQPEAFRAALTALTARAVDHLVLERDRRDLALAAVGLVPAQHRGLDERAAGGAAAGRLPHRP